LNSAPLYFSSNILNNLILKKMSEINDFGSATIRLPNWDAEIKALQERMQGYNEVELVMINDGNYSKMKNGGSSFVSFTDPTTGLTWGVPLQGGYDSNTKTYKFRRIIFGKNRVYRLNNRAEAMEFLCVIKSPLVEGSPLAKYASHVRPLFKVKDAVLEAVKQIRKAEIELMTKNWIMALSDSEIKDFGLVFNINPDKNPVVVVKGILLEKAVKDPERMREIIQNRSKTQITIVIRRAMSVGVIVNDAISGYVYNDTVVLGQNEEEAISKLAQDVDLLQNINKDSLVKTGRVEVPLLPEVELGIMPTFTTTVKKSPSPVAEKVFVEDAEVVSEKEAAPIEFDMMPTPITEEEIFNSDKIQSAVVAKKGGKKS
jgi:hypothetical protein